jgi:peptidoglycan/xylan/chitin deacetylase (PgdA/CDA1 family)
MEHAAEMSQSLTIAFKAILAALQYSGATRLLRPYTSGAGAILMLHHVLPGKPAGFAPNQLLQITPDFLDEVVREVRRQGYDTVTMSEARARMNGEVRATRPFVSFTFDDGYRDNRDHALPVMKRHGVPMTVYVASDFADHRGYLWWAVLERVVAHRRFIAVELAGKLETFRCASDADRQAAYDRIYWHLRTMPETEARALVARLATEAGIDPLEPCRELAMTWDEVREFATDPLVTIGAHTMSHMALAKLSASAAHAEIVGSIKRTEHELGRPCRHFCYPYGGADSAGQREFDIVARLGLETGVTTRKGVLGSKSSLFALPRLSLNGLYQRPPYFKALLSGLPFAMMKAVPRPTAEPSYPAAPASGFCIQRTSQAAGNTQASPPTR